MEQEFINNLRQFETTMKSIIAAEYGSNISQSVKDNFINKSFLDENNIKDMDANNFQEKILKILFDNLINVECKKDISLNGHKYPNVNYGKFLKDGLVEYFRASFGFKFNITYSENPKFKENIDCVDKLNELIGNKFIQLVFNNNAVDITEFAKDPEIIKLNDVKAIEQFAINYPQEKAKCEEESKEEKFNNTGRISIVYDNGKEYLNYLDDNKNSHLVETPESIEDKSEYKKLMQDYSDGLVTKDEVLKRLEEIKNHTVKVETPVQETNDVVPNNGEIKLISEDEYEKLCMKYINGKQVSDYEMSLMKYYDEYYFGSIDKSEVQVPNEKETVSETTTLSSEITPQVPEQVVQNVESVIEQPAESTQIKDIVEENKIIEQVKQELDNNSEVNVVVGQQNNEQPLEEEKEKGKTLELKPTMNTSGFASKFLPFVLIIVTLCVGVIAGVVAFKLTN